MAYKHLVFGRKNEKFKLIYEVQNEAGITFKKRKKGRMNLKILF
jgi:hypothetical protein